jgi:unsaturated rhamnogalacturonyl hydrolase
MLVALMTRLNPLSSKLRLPLASTCLILLLSFAARWARTQGVHDAAARQTSRMASMVMQAWPNGVIATTKKPASWGYEEGVLLDGMAAQWQQTSDPRDLAYIKASLDKYVAPDGSIHIDPQGTPYPVNAHTLDDIELGRGILFLYRTTHEARYQKAAAFLHTQLAAQPRNASGGYWHKQIYPNQMWLDGAYMAEPFRAEYATLFHQPDDFADIAHQFLLMDEHMRDFRSGLLFHGWDESHAMRWADKKTGLSPQIWARAVGWYAMALVDTLDWFPKNRPQRAALVDDLRRTLKAVVAAQDPGTGLWWQVMDRGPGGQGQLAAKGNFPEASASAMFVYALAKAVRLGYVPSAPFQHVAVQGWQGVQREFIHTAPDGSVVLAGTVKAAGLGGTPYRSGTYDYYVAEPTAENDAKGVGAYLLAGSEMERIPRSGRKASSDQ